MTDRIDIELGDPLVRQGIVIVLEGKPLPDIAPTPEATLAWARDVQQGIADFKLAFVELAALQERARQALRLPTGDHGLYSDATKDAYDRRVEAQSRLADLTGLLVLCPARPRT